MQVDVRLVCVRCTECGREDDVEANAAGWIAFRVDVADDPDSPEVTVRHARRGSLGARHRATNESRARRQPVDATHQQRLDDLPS